MRGMGDGRGVERRGGGNGPRVSGGGRGCLLCGSRSRSRDGTLDRGQEGKYEGGEKEGVSVLAVRMKDEGRSESASEMDEWMNEEG